jgi:tricorn protease-like protein
MIFVSWASFFKSFFCRHDYKFYENVYGDGINLLNCRSLWECKKCGHIQRRESLYKGE